MAINKEVLCKETSQKVTTYYKHIDATTSMGLIREIIDNTLRYRYNQFTCPDIRISFLCSTCTLKQIRTLLDAYREVGWNVAIDVNQSQGIFTFRFS